MFNKLVLIFFCSLVSVAFLTLVERKVLSFVGLRFGPFKVGFLGLFQPLLDALKISQKHYNILSNFSFFFYFVSSIFMLSFSLVMWTCSYYIFSFSDWKNSILFLFLFLALHTIMVIFGGWTVYSKYSIISILRSISQMISYEIVFYVVLFFVLFFYGCFSLSNCFFSILFFFYFPLLYLFFFVSVLSELSRNPVDYSESESELVSGFNVDYGSKMFSIIFMSEYSNILFFSMVISFFFFSCDYLMFFLFFIVNLFFIIWVRSMFPRIRYDYFLSFCWKFMMPYLTFYFIFFVCF